MVPIASHAGTKPRRKKRVSDLACLHVMIDNNSHVEIAHTYIPLDDIQKAMKEYKVTLAVTGIEAAPIELHDQA